MKKLILLSLLIASCGKITPTPNDFPPRPATVIVEFPNRTPAPTFKPRPQIIFNADMADAQNFFLLLRTSAVSGDNLWVAERVLYPINAKINGRITPIHSADEFVQNFNQIFNDKIFNALSSTHTENLIAAPEGVRVGLGGELRFNLFCMDAACAQKDFLITQINN